MMELLANKNPPAPAGELGLMFILAVEKKGLSTKPIEFLQLYLIRLPSFLSDMAV
jgi:hypothetical protein